LCFYYQYVFSILYAPFSPDGFVTLAKENEGLRLWRFSDGQLVNTWPVEALTVRWRLNPYHSSTIHIFVFPCVIFRVGAQLITWGDDFRVRTWAVDDRLKQRCKSRLPVMTDKSTLTDESLTAGFCANADSFVLFIYCVAMSKSPDSLNALSRSYEPPSAIDGRSSSGTM